MSKKNRQPLNLSTRPENQVSTPEPQGIAERELAAHPGWQLCYPCPLCHGTAGGICEQYTKRKDSLIVYVKCDTCTFSGPMLYRDGARRATIRRKDEPRA